MHKRSLSRWLLALAVGVVVIVLGVVGYLAVAGPKRDNQAVPQAVPTATQTPAVTPSATTQMPSAQASSTSPTPSGCTTHQGEMRDPKRLQVDRIKVDSPMLSLGTEPNHPDNPAAPPKDQPNTTGWFNQGPAVGSTMGNVILTIHTYSPRNGSNALGNQLYSDKGLKEGDIIRILDAEGKQTCYRYTGNTKVWVATYDPNSTVFHNDSGPAQLAIMICWDHNASTNEWDSRIIFYASLIPA